MDKGVAPIGVFQVSKIILSYDAVANKARMARPHRNAIKIQYMVLYIIHKFIIEANSVSLDS